MKANSRRRWWRAGTLCFCAALLLPDTARAQTEIHAFTEVIQGHLVGGVSVDAIGNVFVADFGDTVWRISPEGERRELASGLYGASGNAIDQEGNLLQSSYYGDYVTKIDRKGQATPFATHGLSGPVGIAINKQTGDVYVANCRGNTVSRIASDRTVSTFAASDLFHCPNGIVADDSGNLYVVNVRDNRMLKVDPQGAVTLFATVSAKGLAHLCFKKDRFYVTAYESHEIYEVSLRGAVKRLLGNGQQDIVDGAAATARLSFPNGIACYPWAPWLYIDEDLDGSETALPRRMIVRKIVIKPDK